MSDPLKRDGETVKAQILRLIEVYQSGFKDKMTESEFFNGYRAALETLKEDISKIETEI